ncbi:hypothetical protein ACFLXN_00390 [Chloroflexota bacterium]
MLPDLSDKNVDVETIAKMALADDEVLRELLANLVVKKNEIRYNSLNALLYIAEKKPELLYPNWDVFVGLLGSNNSHHQYIAIFLIANLVKIDTENRFDAIFNDYYGILEGDTTIAAANLVKNSGKIAIAKPSLEPLITEKLLNIDTLHKGKQKSLIKGIAIEAFTEYYGRSTRKDKILHFVKQQLNSDSPKAMHNAAEFLSSFGDRKK